MRARVLALCFALVALAQPCAAAAGATKEFLTLAESAMRAARAATHYLRTENPAVASIELATARKRWTTLAERFAQELPDVFEGNAAFPGIFARIDELWAKAHGLLREGRIQAARDEVEQGIEQYRKARRASWLFAYSDCIVEMNRAVDALWRWRGQQPIALDDPGTRRRIAAQTAIARYLYRRCREEAPSELRDEEFERLFEGALAGLEAMSAAVEQRDAGRFLRILLELRSFDRLLRFHYG